MQGATHCRSILANAWMTCALIHWARLGPGPGGRWYPSHSPWSAGAEFITESASSRPRIAYSSHSYHRYCTLWLCARLAVGHKTRMWRVQKNERDRVSSHTIEVYSSHWTKWANQEDYGRYLRAYESILSDHQFSWSRKEQALIHWRGFQMPFILQA